MPPTELDMRGFERGLRDLAKRFDPRAITFELELVADELLRRAIDSPIPRDQGNLERSATVNRNVQRKEVVFGFNRVYAAFQDQPGRSGIVTVKPRRKKMLYIPISQRGRMHRYGNNPNNEGLIWGVDYVLKKSVDIRIKPYGSALGPNHYFSETLKKNVNFMLDALAKRLERLIKGKGGASAT